jgi:Nif-specific regulatory protein
LVAQTVHAFSGRQAGPFVAVNCAAFSESLLESELFGHEKGAFTGAESRRQGQFELAHRGTIFLDEVGELSPACQARLLRLLEGQPFQRLGGAEQIRVDVRIVAATNRDLREMVQAGTFREDLWYRLRVIELVTPPLRERGSDIMLLATHFLERFRAETGRGPQRFSHPAATAMMRYGWPGNVRELRNAVERAVVLSTSEEVAPGDLGLTSPPPARAGALRSLADAEQQHIDFVLHAVCGNKTEACKILKIGRATLYNKLNRRGAAVQRVGERPSP